MRSRNSANRLVALLAVPLVLGVAAPAGADWFGISVGGDDFAFSLGFGDWGPYGHAWSDPGWNVNYRVALSGYGQWVWVDGLGEVWYPSVAADWRPYTYGRWVYTGVGWTWVAYEPWGYFPHHYGEWALTGFGWVWVPGYTYRPAHVVWVGYGSHVGWYPCAPAGWSHSHRGFWHGYDHGYRDGVRHGYRRGYDDGYWDGWQDARYATYVPWDRFTSENVARAALDPRDVSRNLTRANARPLQAAPARTEVSRRIGRDVPEVRVEQRQVSIDGRSVTVARPEGASRSVATHAREAVERALAPDAARQAASRRQRALETGSEATTGRPAAPVASRTRGQDRPVTGDAERATPSSARGSRAAAPRRPTSEAGRGETSVPRSTAPRQGASDRPAARTSSRSASDGSSRTSSRSETVRRPVSTRQPPEADPALRRDPPAAGAPSRTQRSASRQARPPQTGSSKPSTRPRVTADRTDTGSTRSRASAASSSGRTGRSVRAERAGTPNRATAANRSGQPAQAQSTERPQRTRRAPAGSKPDKPERN